YIRHGLIASIYSIYLHEILGAAKLKRLSATICFPMLDCIEIDPKNEATATVIWLHGLGADGNDFVPTVDELGLPAGHGLRFVFPNAPVQPVTINGGMAMRAWYDILGVDVAQ